MAERNPTHAEIREDRSTEKRRGRVTHQYYIKLTNPKPLTTLHNMRLDDGRYVEDRILEGDPEQRIKVWNFVEEVSNPGFSGPKRKHLVQYLNKNPCLIVYEGQRRLVKERIYVRRMTVQEVLADHLDWERVTMFDKLTGRKASGRSAPCKRNLEVYLSRNPNKTVYVGQDLDPHPEDRLSGEKAEKAERESARVDTWNPELNRRITGNARTTAARLGQYFRDHPTHELYVGQDKEDYVPPATPRFGTSVLQSIASAQKFLEARRNHDDGTCYLNNDSDCIICRSLHSSKEQYEIEETKYVPTPLPEDDLQRFVDGLPRGRDNPLEDENGTIQGLSDRAQKKRRLSTTTRSTDALETGLPDKQVEAGRRKTAFSENGELRHEAAERDEGDVNAGLSFHPVGGKVSSIKESLDKQLGGEGVSSKAEENQIATLVSEALQLGSEGKNGFPKRIEFSSSLDVEAKNTFQDTLLEANKNSIPDIDDFLDVSGILNQTQQHPLSSPSAKKDLAMQGLSPASLTVKSVPSTPVAWEDGLVHEETDKVQESFVTPSLLLSSTEAVGEGDLPAPSSENGSELDILERPLSPSFYTTLGSDENS